MTAEFKTPVTSMTFEEGFERPRVVSPRGSGLLVSVTRKGEETPWLGLMLGHMNTGMGWRQEGGTVAVSGHVATAAIFVPALGQIVYGMECRWMPVIAENDLAAIPEDRIGEWRGMAMRQIADADGTVLDTPPAI